MKYIIILLLLCSCSSKDVKKKTAAPKKDVVQQLSAEEVCLNKISSIKSSNKEIIPPDIDYRSTYLVARSSPILFIKTPELSDTNDKVILGHRKRFLGRNNPYSFLLSSTNRSFYKRNPKVSREVFLRNGYLYHPDPNFNYALYQLISLNILFNEEEAYIRKAANIYKIARKYGTYFYEDGPYKGRMASIDLFDQVSLSKDELIPIHLSLSAAKDRYFFDKIVPTFISDTYVAANLTYGDETFESLFSRDNDRLTLDCNSKDFDSSKFHQRGEKIAILKRTIMEQVLERLPFDEPEHELHQEDGKLRDSWLNFFYKGKLKYQYKNELMVEENRVYDHLGHARPPQVCVDFVVDTIDRSAGSWYSGVSERKHPHKTKGKFSSSTFRYVKDGEEMHYAFRNITGFTHFVKDHPEFFELITVDEKKQFKEKDFPDFLSDLNVKEGDIVFIKGEVPWDDNTHYHSFYVYQTSPIDNFPISLGANAGPASLRPWRIERNRTPKRYIFQIVRIKQKLLDLFEN